MLNFFKQSQKSGRQNNALIVIWFLTAYLGMFFISYMVPMYLSRYLIFALPAYYILLVISACSLTKHPVTEKILLSVLVLSFVFSVDINPEKKHNAASAIRFAGLLKDERTLVVVIPYDFLPTFAYHYNRSYFSRVDDEREYYLTDSLLKREHIFLLNTEYELRALDLDKFKKIILFSAGDGAVKRSVLQELRSQHSFLMTRKFEDSYELNIFIAHRQL